MSKISGIGLDSSQIVTNSSFTAKGQLIVGTGINTATIFPPGTDGQVLSADSTQVSGLRWVAAGGAGVGDVTGPASSTDMAIARFDGTTGKLIGDSAVTIDDSANVVTAGSVTAGSFSTSSTVTATGIVNNGSLVVEYVNPGAYPYTAVANDYYISVTSSSARTINLPDAPVTGRVFVIKDKTGQAATNNITVRAAGGVVQIDGATSFLIDANYGSISVVFNGTAYEIF